MVCRQAGYLQRVIPCTGSSLNRTLAVLAICFAVGALAIAHSGTAANQRTSNKCESAGGSEAGSVPINGVCKARDSNEEVANVGCKKASANEVGDQTCGKCEGDTYFLYKGGCYSTSDATRQKLYTEAMAGVCSPAASEYFAPTEAINVLCCWAQPAGGRAPKWLARSCPEAKVGLEESIGGSSPCFVR